MIGHAARALVVLNLLAVAPQPAPEPIVRVVIGQKPPLLANQQIQIDVQLLVPNFFMSPPRFPTLDVPGAVVNMPDESGVNLNETIEGHSYAGIQKTYVFIASRAGRYQLPPGAITFTYAREPGSAAAAATVTIPPTAIVVEWPALIRPPDGGPAALVAKVTMTQELDRDPATLHAGEALTRTVIAHVDHSQAMFIPPPHFDVPEGVRVYTRDPVLLDERQDRVGLTGGRRTDRAIYTFDKAGTFELPAIDIPWLDAGSARSRTARAAAITVVVAPAASQTAIAPEPPPTADDGSVTRDRRRFAWLAGVTIATLGLAVFIGRLVRRRLPRFQAAWQQRRQMHAASEVAMFAGLVRACEAGDAVQAYSRLLPWARSVEASSWSDLAIRWNDAALNTEVQRLEASLYADSAGARNSWSGQALRRALEAGRRNGRNRTASVRSALPPLNP